MLNISWINSVILNFSKFCINPLCSGLDVNKNVNSRINLIFWFIPPFILGVMIDKVMQRLRTLQKCVAAYPRWNLLARIITGHPTSNIHLHRIKKSFNCLYVYRDCLHWEFRYFLLKIFHNFFGGIFQYRKDVFVFIEEFREKFEKYQ